MRIWDIHPGYLNRQSLLGEHRELHGIVSILANRKKGYARHPETLRWKGFEGALYPRHQLLREEMTLRGYKERSPVVIQSKRDKWPAVYIDPPPVQFDLLKEKYEGKLPGRIPLPATTRQLWAQHKYSVLARDPQRYKEIGSQVSCFHKQEYFDDLCVEVAELLSQRPAMGRLKNVLEHMWGHVSEYEGTKKYDIRRINQSDLLHGIQHLAIKHQVSYLIHSTALSELGAWL